MKIKVLNNVAGNSFSFAPGNEVDVSAEIGKSLVKAGHAIEINAGKAKKQTAANKMTKVENRAK